MKTLTDLEKKLIVALAKLVDGINGVTATVGTAIQAEFIGAAEDEAEKAEDLVMAELGVDLCEYADGLN